MKYLEGKRLYKRSWCTNGILFEYHPFFYKCLLKQTVWLLLYANVAMELN